MMWRNGKRRVCKTPTKNCFCCICLVIVNLIKLSLSYVGVIYQIARKFGRELNLVVWRSTTELPNEISANI